MAIKDGTRRVAVPVVDSRKARPTTSEKACDHEKRLLSSWFGGGVLVVMIHAELRDATRPLRALFTWWGMDCPRTMPLMEVMCPLRNLGSSFQKK